jgi:NAD(P)H-dependent flavin oxidoreductase YrpB (nitropropane dioxygenase family)
VNKRLETPFTTTYGLQHPIALAPMAFVGTSPGLAVAVCKAGGLGSLAVGPLPAEAVRGLIRAFKASTDGPLHVNFITFLATQPQIQACIDEEVSVVSFHWGHPPRVLVSALQRAGIRVWEQVGSVCAAKESVDSGIDLIIVQGSEAGGHNYGSLPTFVLVPSVLEAVAPTPILAAGGISTGRQLAAALLLGADGVSIGTRFVASTEAFAHPEYKQRLAAALGTDTRLTSVYGPNMPQFNPMRVLDVGLANEFAGREEAAPKDLESQPIIATMTLAGEKLPLHRFSSFVPTPDTEGRIEDLPFLAGQGVGLIHNIIPVAQIVQTIVGDAAAALSALTVRSLE